MALLMSTQQGMLSLVFKVTKRKDRSQKQEINLPPGMKRRNPGTKKIALDTPASTATQVNTHSKDAVINTDQYSHTSLSIQSE